MRRSGLERLEAVSGRAAQIAEKPQVVTNRPAFRTPVDYPYQYPYTAPYTGSQRVSERLRRSDRVFDVFPQVRGIVRGIS
jgi:hypothetical protein